MNKNLELLQAYPFEKLTALKAGFTPPDHLAHIALSIGEPKHEPPRFVVETLRNTLDKLANYPSTKGTSELREAIAQWASRRFQLSQLDPETEVLPVNGTREALFAFAQTVIEASSIEMTDKPLVVSPNPFYQIYEGAALLAGADPYFLNCTKENNFIPNFKQVDASVWQRCQLLYLCSPGNPTGAVLNLEHYQTLLTLSDQYDFVIASDECYSELYFDEANPPLGLLQACEQLNRHSYKNAVVFHSLSKRSNLPGLRSGFVAGDKAILQAFLKYRTYHGCAMPIQNQLASIAAWNDEKHVQESRQLYREKFAAVLSILNGSLDVTQPDAGFYLWAITPIDEAEFAQRLYAEQNITVLPGSFLARDVEGINPGKNRIRMALVAPLAECIEAAERIKTFVQSLDA